MKYVFKKNPIVISLGGSIIYPKELDISYLKKLNTFFRNQTKRGQKFIIVVGGGKLARDYQTSAIAVKKISNFANDWLGIEATKLNAKLLQTIFADIASPTIITKRGELKQLNYPITFCSGWQPGASTDRVAAWLAMDFNAKEIINASNISQVYDRDPKTHKNAKALTTLTWDQYLKIIPHKWTPGANTPFDIEASKLAKEHELTTIFLNGKNLANLKNLLQGKTFTGTIIN
ncbi:MAG: UMP kinase [Candidatus Harrisonbacteria bacterium CG10_big_fil_rev_8_21_14_0_10_45_28]|uniref:Uridylate kinase n=1 Tax=Candidatus Harrisonbacteria bacterium CG10_big_fil_rev_8_21_14_0_10_45_28 TaxID=1974586 RepID=A0A2H0UNF4_9BACT|nr:MAG: UMP kinase [Candidatus Harrisonbacteria bacterium CG10_big_fil_rev_8_21_14_0_10_45_28]